MLCGLLVFISPCVLPMLPVYVSYFVAGEETNWKKTLLNASAFSIGVMLFWTVFLTILSIIGYQAKLFLNEYEWQVNFAAGVIIILLGLQFIGVIKIPFLEKQNEVSVTLKTFTGFISAFVMGVIFAISMGPCVIAFGSFVMVSAVVDANRWYTGAIIGLAFSGTMGVLFIVGALGINKLKKIFTFIKSHYKVINIISGSILILLGLVMALGLMHYVTGWFTSIQTWFKGLFKKETAEEALAIISSLLN